MKAYIYGTNDEYDYNKIHLCPVCKKGSAQIIEVEPEFEDEDLQVMVNPCKKCEDDKLRKIAEKRNQALLKFEIEKVPDLMRSAGFYEVFVKASLDDFEINYRKYHDKSVYLYGPVGCGKSHLAAALLRQNIIERKQVAFISMTKLLLDLKASFESKKGKTSSEILEFYATIPNLCLDDFGAEKLTDWSYSVIFSILDRRYGNMLHTIITSNSPLSELVPCVGERIASRVAGMCIVTGKQIGRAHV